MRLGYACINTELRAEGVFSSRTCVMATLVALGPAAGVARLREMTLANIADLQRTLEWNEAHGIRLFRITSNLFPHLGHHLLPARWYAAASAARAYLQGDTEFAHAALRAVGRWATAHGHRLTMHMTPYVQLGAPAGAVRTRTIADLAVYRAIFRALGGRDHCLVLHGGGVYQRAGEPKDVAKRATLARWLVTWRALPADLRAWCALENDERHYGAREVLEFCEAHGVAMCFDAFHNAISADHLIVTPAVLARIRATWRGRHAVAKFHLSEQAPGAPFGTHSDMVARMPAWMFAHPCDVMIEAKLKEQAVAALHRRYFRREVRAGRVLWEPQG